MCNNIFRKEWHHVKAFQIHIIENEQPTAATTAWYINTETRKINRQVENEPDINILKMIVNIRNWNRYQKQTS